MARLSRLAALALLTLLAAPPLHTHANPFTYNIVVSNPTSYDAWITIYSLGKVRIEKAGRVGAHGKVSFKDATFTPGSYHHVRYEFMRGNKKVCDTSAQVLVTKNEYGNGAYTSGYYDGRSHCHISWNSSSSIP